MVQLTLPRNSRIKTGKTWNKPQGKGKWKEFRVYRWNSEGGENPVGPQVEAEFRTHGRPLAWIKFKEFPSCHCTHASLRAARLLHNQTAGRPIRDVGVVVSDYALSQTSIRSPQTPDQAKFSQSFAVAAMLQRGTAGVDAFAVDALEDEGIRSLSTGRRLAAKRDSLELEAHVVVFLEDGARLEAREFIDLDDCSEPPDFAGRPNSVGILNRGAIRQTQRRSCP